MVRTPFLLALVVLSACSVAPADDADARARALAHRTIVLDGHIDVPYRLRSRPDDVSQATEGGDFDYPRAVAGGLDAPFFSIYVPAEYEEKGGAKALADELIDGVEALAARAPDKFRMARSVADVHAAFADRRIALLMGMENGSPVEGDLRNLDHFHGRGIRYITLCHSKDNHICDSSFDTRHTSKGLTPFGRDVVRRMNELGILIDVSHVSDDTFFQVLELSRVPVIASHSSCRHFTPGFERNMSDAMIRRLAERGGVIQINFGSSFLLDDIRRAGEERRAALERWRIEHGLAPGAPELRERARQWSRENPSRFADVKDVADHIDHVVRLVGVDHVGFGSDFDGVGDSLPTGLKDVSMYPNLLAELLRRGYSEPDLEKICSGNVLRVLGAAERFAAGS